MTVYDMTAKLIERERKPVKVEPERKSDLDKLLTWAEGFGYEPYYKGLKTRKNLR